MGIECRQPRSSARSKGPTTSSRVTSPTTNVHETPASRARRRAFAIARPAKSTPTALHPCRARYTTFVPVPQPRSSARPDGCDDTKRSSSRSEEHTSELQSRPHLVCRLLLEKKKTHQAALIRSVP